MERCDFASVITTIRRFISDDHYYNQNDFIGDLLADFLGAEESADFSLDNGQICRWMNGLSKVSPKISRFYLDKGNQIMLAAQISDTFIPIMSDSAMAVQELHGLLMQDYTVSEEKKSLLCRDYPCLDNRTKGLFMAELICFGMEREFVKRDIRVKNLLATGNLSPAVSDYIFDEGVPRPCRNFCGRDQELAEIHDLLIDHNKVFLHGIPGIGKSELAKAYAKIHKKDYTNILYLTYSGDLKKDITDLDFADDQSADSEEDRFRKHNRFLRTLKDDSLIIIDNFNTTSSRDEFLPVVLKYRCRILFTTRSTFPGQTCFPVTEIKDKENLFQLAGKFYADAKSYRPIIEEIIDTVHCHTLAVELAARLLETGMLNPDEVLNKLLKERAAFDAADKINLSKDGRSQRATYYNHIHTLFSLFRLSETEKGIMRSLSLIPLTGISARLFGRWLNYTDLNEINELIELGFIQEKAGCCISLHPMMQEVTAAELTPGIENCHAMLENIRTACQLHGLNVSYYKLMFQTVENTIRIAIKDDDTFYQLLLQDVFAYMESYNYQSGMQMILDELKKLQNGSPASAATDKALLLENRAAMEKDPKKAARLLQEAVALLPEVNSGNALLVSNLQANLGGMYRLTGNYTLAKQYMESAIQILNQYNLIGYHDSYVQTVNYAILLNDMGYPRQGLTGLRKIEPVVRKQNPVSLDYATIQQSMGYLNLSCGETSQALECFQKALAIFAKIYENEPELLAEKKAEIPPVLQMAKPSTVNYLMLNG